MKPHLPAVVLTFVFFLAVAGVIQAHPPTGIVLDRAGNIYFSDLETIWRLDTNGVLSVFRAGVSGRHVHELAIDDQDNIYGADYSYESQKFISAIWKMTPDGQFQYLLEPTDKPPPGMSIWRDREGNNYLVEQNNHTRTQTLILRRSPDGKVITLAGGAYGHADGKGTAAKFSSVGNIAFGPEGDLYVTDGATVRRVSKDGVVTTLARELEARTNEDKTPVFADSQQNLTGIAVDALRNVYVADSNNRRLLKLDSANNVSVVLRTDPPFFPNGVFAGPDGSVYVLEIALTLPATWAGPRVRRISPDGKSTILATIGSVGEKPGPSPPRRRDAGEPQTTFQTLISLPSAKYAALVLGVVIVGACVMIWKRRKRQ
jgi:hypothetical protein